MNDLIAKPLEGEIIAPGDGVWVVGRQRPFEARGDRIKLPSGLTIKELLDTAIDRRSRLAEYVAYVDGIPIPSHMHDKVRVKAGHTVTYAPQLKGGETGRSIATIALAVVALAAAIILPPLVGPIVAGLIGAGIVIGGGLLINALFPVAPQTTLQDKRKGFDTTFSISGSRNAADPFGPVPIIFGKMRVWPRYAARPYVDFSGNDQYLKMLFVVGYGSLAVSDLRIGETPLADFQDVIVHTFEDYMDGDSPAPSLYTKQVFQEQLNIELTQALSWQTRVTAQAIDAISVILTLPNGWYEVDATTGDLLGRDIELQAQYRVFGSVGGWSALDDFTVADFKTKKPRIVGLTISGLTADQYEVRVRKGSNDSGDTEIVEDVFWTVITSSRNSPPIVFNKSLTLIEVGIKATNQLSGVVDAFNCIAEARVISWQGTSPGWVPSTLSRNPADAFRWVLQGPAINEVVPDEQLNLTSLQGWHDYCATNGFEFNYEAARRLSVFDTLLMIAASGKARVVRTDGLWGVVWDEESLPVSQHFTPRNSWGFQEQRAYFNQPDALRVTFINEDKAYAADEIRVYTAGYNATNATRFESAEFPGVTNETQVTTLAQFHSQQTTDRPSVYTLMTDWQSLSCTVGDKIYCAHDAILIGQKAGRVISVSGDAIELDEQVLFEASTAYALRFRQSDGTSVLRDVAGHALGWSSSFALEPSAFADPQVGDLAMFGISAPGPAQLLRVRDIEWLPDLTARITLVDD